MTEIIVFTPEAYSGGQQGAETIQVTVHVQAEVISPKLALRSANVWLAMNAGHLLQVSNPELVLGDALQWRFDVFLTVPQLDPAGTVSRNFIGQMRLDAVTGEVVTPQRLIEELRANTDALAAH
jgi:hypothetical protein